MYTFSLGGFNGWNTSCCFKVPPWYYWPWNVSKIKRRGPSDCDKWYYHIMLSYRVFIPVWEKNEKYTGCYYYSIGIAVNRRLLSQYAAQTSDGPSERIRIRAGTKQVDMEKIHLPSLSCCWQWCGPNCRRKLWYQKYRWNEGLIWNRADRRNQK